MKSVADLISKMNKLLNKTQKMLGLLVFVCSILASFFELLGVSVIAPLIDVLVNPQELLNNSFVMMIVPGNMSEQMTESGRKTLMIVVIIGVIIVYLIKNLFFIFNTWLKNKYAFKIQREMSVEMMKRYISRGYAFFLDHNYSELRQGMDGDVRALYYIVSGIMQIVTQVLIVGLIGVYMLYKDWHLAVGAIITGVLCLVLVLGLFKRRMSESGRILRELSIKAEKTMEETLHGIKLVMISHKERYFVDKYNNEVTGRNKVDVVKTAGTEYPMYIIEAVSITGIMLSLCFRVISLEEPEKYVAVLGAFAVGMFRILPAIGKISSTVNSIISSVPSLNSVYDNLVLQEAPSEKKTLSNSEDKLKNGTERSEMNPVESKELVRFSDCIEVKNLSFAYKSGSKNVLDGVSFEIKKGSSVGIVGESGAGKSTLADIMMGLLRPSSGTVTIDGVDLNELTSKEWNGIGYVPQTIFLTDSTIAENVAYGVAKNDIDMDCVRQALVRAKVLEFIDSLPTGVNTMVGDRGVRLSGGQRQRIGIARALYTSPEILVLDEATSALDNDTEKEMMKAIEDLRGEITMIIIAHRLTTIKDCDKILEVKDGHITEKNYEQLTAQ